MTYFLSWKRDIGSICFNFPPFKDRILIKIHYCWTDPNSQSPEFHCLCSLAAVFLYNTAIAYRLQRFRMYKQVVEKHFSFLYRILVKSTLTWQKVTFVVADQAPWHKTFSLIVEAKISTETANLFEGCYSTVRCLMPNIPLNWPHHCDLGCTRNSLSWSLPYFSTLL